MSTPCCGARSQSRQIDISRLPVGQQQVIISQQPCGCNSGCRRVALFHPRPVIDPAVEGGSDWTVKAIARVRFSGYCGPAAEVEVDFKTGVILDLIGCDIEVAVELVEVLGTPPDATNLFTYGAVVACCGAGGARGCATRTTALTEVQAPGSVNVIPIPPFAYAVMFVPIPADVALFFSETTSVSQLGSGVGTPIMTLTGDMVPTDGWTLVGGAESIMVGNGAVGEENALSYEVLFLIGV